MVRSVAVQGYWSDAPGWSVLERNLNSRLSILYVVTGVVLLVVPLLGFELLPWLTVVVLILGGVRAILSGCLHH